MQKTTDIYDYLKPSPGREPLPNESECPVCHYFYADNPDVQRILRARDPSGRLLFQAQCKCRLAEDRKQSALDRLHLESNMPHLEAPRTFDNFEARPGTEAMITAARRFIQGEGPRMLVLTGNNGCGKSHVLEAIGRAFLERERSVRYELAPALLDRFRSTYNPDNPEDLGGLLSWYSRRHVLLIDDIGMERATEFAREKLTYLVEDRLQSERRLAVTTNKRDHEMVEHMGPRLASRLFATNPKLGEVALVVNDATDYRTGQR